MRFEFKEANKDGALAKFLNKHPDLQLVAVIALYPVMLIGSTAVCLARFFRALWLGFLEACYEFQAISYDVRAFNSAIKYVFDKTKIQHLIRR